MGRRQWIALAVSIVIAQGAGLFGSVFTSSAIPTWYATLTRPEIAPPNWVFGPVWTTLFLLMGIAAFVVWRKGFERDEVRFALKIYGVQLALNVAWSLIFFGLKSPGWALIEIAILWCAIATCIWTFAKVSTRAAWLLAPYLAWVSFASYLNYLFWMLNG